MGKGTTNKLASEISVYWKQSLAARNEWYFVEQILQIIDREKIKVLNRYRENHGEELITPEPTRYKDFQGQQHTEWIVDVPKPWVNLISKVGKS